MFFFFCSIDTTGNYLIIRDFSKVSNSLDDYSENATKLGYKNLTSTDLQGMPGLFSNWPEDFRRFNSYQFYDIFVSCTYKGNQKNCQESNFKLFEHSEMFNCYTFQDKDRMALKSGPNAGLTMIVYIGKYNEILHFI